MLNEILFFVTILSSLSLTCLAFRLFGKVGLYAWVAFATVVANIEVVKCVDIFGLAVTLGNVLYGSTFLCTDILSENYGGKQSRKAVWIGFFSLIAFTLITQLGLRFIPNEQDFASPLMEQLFDLTPRICAASFISFLITNTLDTYTYEWISSWTKKKWIRNNLSTMTSQLLDSFLFTFGAFYGVFDMDMLIELSLTTYAMKFLIALLDTPFLYWACRIKNKHNIE